jgi:SAM-dependent methyltransferase
MPKRSEEVKETAETANHHPSPAPSSEDDPFLRIAPFYDELMDSIPYSDWVDYVEKVMGAYGFKPRRILDVACGTGTAALLLAERGYSVVGIDRSAPMLEAAREKAAAAGREIEFHRQDARELRLKEKFDLALCLYDSFNYILEDEELLAAFRGVRRALQPGGAFFFDLNSLYSFKAELFTQRSAVKAEIGYEWRSRFDPFSRISEVEMDFRPPVGEPFQIVHRQRAYLVQEVIGLLRKARFEVVALFEAYTLLPPGRFSERIFYLAKKPGGSRE